MMPCKYETYAPRDIGELLDLLDMMMLTSPTFKDDYFVDRNIDTVFSALNNGLNHIRGAVGDERYSALADISDRMRAHFEAVSDAKTQDTLAGRALIEEMEDILLDRKPPS